MVSTKTAKPRKKSGLGCGFTAVIGLIMIALLVVNGNAIEVSSTSAVPL